MTLELTNYHALPCCTEIFRINGQDADSDYFGSGYDNDCENAEEYCCSNRVWERTDDEEQIKKAMEKYNITREEFDEICDKLEELLTVGSCGWCV